MVSHAAIAGLVIQALIAALIPIAAFTYLNRKYSISLRPIAVGVMVFIAFSQVFEPALNAYILNVNPITAVIKNNPYWYALYGALAAGVFEEIGRYAGFMIFLGENRERKDGLAYGLGHGGIEALLVGLMSSIQSMISANLINSGQFDAIYSKTASPEMIASVKNSLEALTLTNGLFGGIERIGAFLLQVALSLLVLYAINSKKLHYVGLAILLHTAFNFVAVYHKTIGLNIVIAEVFIIIMAIVSVLYIRKTKEEHTKEKEAE
ncbi:YhfC family intramembrane metalloprotease [Ectobacillus polymachus]|uniref:YhfC family intramembrane metalloprotease n=1 Tax=Ectobacillus polymachus TaxID=1508806 RepID=UPI003A84D893